MNYKIIGKGKITSLESNKLTCPAPDIVRILQNGNFFVLSFWRSVSNDSTHINVGQVTVFPFNITPLRVLELKKN